MTTTLTNLLKTIGNKAYDSTKGIASDIADHVKEQIGKYALGGTVLISICPVRESSNWD